MVPNNKPIMHLLNFLSFFYKKRESNVYFSMLGNQTMPLVFIKFFPNKPTQFKKLWIHIVFTCATVSHSVCVYKDQIGNSAV